MASLLLRLGNASKLESVNVNLQRKDASLRLKKTKDSKSVVK